MVADIRSLTASLAEFEAKARALVLVSEDNPPTSEDIERLRPSTNLQVGDRGKVQWYNLLREVQGELAATLEVGFMIDNHTFMEESLFCEWAYIANLDDGLFEVYRGFQTEIKDQAGRYAVSVTPPFTPYYKGQKQYFPVTLIASFPLLAIPKDWIEQVNAIGEQE